MKSGTVRFILLTNCRDANEVKKHNATRQQNNLPPIADTEVVSVPTGSITKVVPLGEGGVHWNEKVRSQVVGKDFSYMVTQTVEEVNALANEPLPLLRSALLRLKPKKSANPKENIEVVTFVGDRALVRSSGGLSLYTATQTVALFTDYEEV